MVPHAYFLKRVLHPHPKEHGDLEGHWIVGECFKLRLPVPMGVLRRSQHGMATRKGTVEPGVSKHKGSWEIHAEKTQKRIQLQLVPVDLGQVTYPLRASVSPAATLGS